MHPVARVSIKYWNNLRTQQSIFSARFYCALLTLHVSALISGHLRKLFQYLIYIYSVLMVLCFVHQLLF
jgi:hypothetical protein